MPRCLTPGAGEAGELWAELGAILPPQGVPGPTGQDPVSAATPTLFLSPPPLLLLPVILPVFIF